MNSSPDRGKFQVNAALKRVEEGTTTAEEAEQLIEFYTSFEAQRKELEKTNEWKTDNLEYDLRSTSWICDKAKANEYYAQNLYAALCNNEFIKNEVWPKLIDKRWTCSWRSAGGIVANMIEQGDYIDWYCSGIRGDLSDEEYINMSKEDQEKYLYMKTKFVSESVVTDEIRKDLFELGWVVVDSEE